MDSRSNRRPTPHVDQLRQQTVLAKFGELALKSDDLNEILTEACRLVGEGLGTDLAKVMRLEDGGETLLVSAGMGWKPGIVGVLTLRVAESRSESLALQTGNPTISPNIATETRFKYPQFLIDNGVKALANVAIIGSEGRSAFGILQVDSRQPRRFTDSDTAFLRSYANLIAAAVDRLRVIEEVRHAFHEASRARIEADSALIEADSARIEADRANKAKSRFLSNMSHELRTPLNGVLGYAELIRREDNLSATQEARLDALAGAGRHLLQMINRVLSLSQIEAEKTNLEVVECDLHGLVAPCLDSVRPAAEPKKIRLDLIVAPDLPHSILVDAVRLRQVLINLLGNAVKFTHQGSIELRLLLSPDPLRLRIEVLDTGPGIPAGQHDRLFQEFERLDDGDTSVPEGAGLGLAISARLATIMGGNIGHEDNPPGGSIFWVELPLKASLQDTASQADVPAIDAPATSAFPTPARPLRVLVVDDTPMNRDIAGAFLRASGHRITYAEGGAEAVAAVAAADFDVVLMDIRMPEVDGIEATRRIHLLEGSRGQVPIVAMTALALPEEIEKCRLAGIIGHVIKPFTFETLTSATVRAAQEAWKGSEARQAG